jgi:hypothetical protein
MEYSCFQSGKHVSVNYCKKHCENFEKWNVDKKRWVACSLVDFLIVSIQKHILNYLK